MELPVFENAYIFKAIGWAIVNSFWQIGSLWLLYQFLTTIDKRLPALVKHNLSIVLLMTSFIWFLVTIVQNYRLLTVTADSVEIIINGGWKTRLLPFTNLLPYLSVVYLVLLCFSALRFYKNLSVTRLLQSEGLIKAPIDLRLFTTHTALHLGIKKNIKVWLSEHVDVPSVAGFIKPVILLPAAFISHLSIRQTEAILLHELAHIKRNDHLVNLLQSVVELILFFNPFAMLLSKTAKKERENCCDDWVINFQYEKYQYARALLVLEEQRHIPQYRVMLAATNGKKNLLLRIKRLYSAHPNTNFSSIHKLKLVGVCIFLLSGMFTLFPYIIKEPVNDITRVFDKKVGILAKAERQSKENSLKDIFRSEPIKSINEKALIPKKNKIRNQLSYEQDGDFVNAFINEELLNPGSQVEPILARAVEKEINNSRILVRIEEEQSGKKPTNTYYFEINSINGNAVIKPLIILNKFYTPVKKTIIGNLPDSVDTSIKPVAKKRITS